jgi:hypothetical protein
MPDARHASDARNSMEATNQQPMSFFNSRKIRHTGRKFSHSAVSVGKNIFPKQIKDSPLNLFFPFSKIYIWDLVVHEVRLFNVGIL